MEEFLRMFTGIIEAVGVIARIGKKSGNLEVEIEVLDFLDDVRIGDSISVDGVCLSVCRKTGASFSADLLAETVKRSTFDSACAGRRVNLEKSLKSGSRFSGHIVTGHIDETGEILEVKNYSGDRELKIKVRPETVRYIVEKGSVAVNGVSLTVVNEGKDYFTVRLIPLTGEKTNLGKVRKGNKVNIEADILAKYAAKASGRDKPSRITLEFLKEKGFE